jgi:hypothetical protein
MGYDKHFLDENMLVQKRYHRFFGNLVTHIFGPDSWQQKKHFFGHGTFLIKDGSEIHFWEDKWLGNTSLREQYPALYAIVRHKGDTLAQVLESNPPNMTFRRNLFGPRFFLGVLASTLG